MVATRTGSTATKGKIRKRQKYSEMSEDQRARQRSAVKKWQAANPDKVRAIERKRQSTTRKYANLTPEEKANARARMRKWYARHRDEQRQRMKFWQKKNKSHLKEYDKKYRTKNRSRILRAGREWHFKKKYGITIAQRDQMFADQGFACKTCGTKDPRHSRGWHVDHCHKTGRVRGILCNHCNAGIGFAGDNIEILQNWINYLRSPP